MAASLHTMEPFALETAKQDAALGCTHSHHGANNSFQYSSGDIAFSSGHLTISKWMTIQMMAVTIRKLVGLIYGERLMIKFCTYNTYHTRITNATATLRPTSKAATDTNNQLFILTAAWSTFGHWGFSEQVFSHAKVPWAHWALNTIWRQDRMWLKEQTLFSFAKALKKPLHPPTVSPGIQTDAWDLTMSEAQIRWWKFSHSDARHVFVPQHRKYPGTLL